MGIKTINIKEETWNLAQRKFPRQVSKMIEEYLQGLLSIELPELKDDVDLMEAEKNQLEQQQQQIKLKIDSLKANIKKKTADLDKEAKEEVDKKIKMSKALKNAGILENW